MPTTFADGLMDRAYKTLDQAASAKTPNATFTKAFLAATHAAAAVITARISEDERSQMAKPESLWVALTLADPFYEPWADYFAAHARQRNLADTNARNAVTRDQAETMLRDVSVFLTSAANAVRKVQGAAS